MRNFGYLLREYFESILSPLYRMLKWEMSRSYVRICSNSITLWMWGVVLSWYWIFSLFSNEIPIYCSSVLWLKPVVTDPYLHTQQMWIFLYFQVLFENCVNVYASSIHSVTPSLSSKRTTIFPFSGCQAAVSWELRAILFVTASKSSQNNPYIPTCNYSTLAGPRTILWIFCCCPLYA